MLKRITRDYEKFQKSQIYNSTVELANDDIFKWNITIEGPEDYPYNQKRLNITLIFPPTYPTNPPLAKFTNKMFHPNVDKSGEICISTLKKDWSPVFTPEVVVLSIISLLLEPNPDDPLNEKASEMFLNNRKEYNKKINTLLNTK